MKAKEEKSEKLSINKFSSLKIENEDIVIYF